MALNLHAESRGGARHIRQQVACQWGVGWRGGSDKPASGDTEALTRDGEIASRAGWQVDVAQGHRIARERQHASRRRRSFLK